MSVHKITDFTPLAVSLVGRYGRRPEYLVISEESWDYLEERGFNPESFTPDELDDICDYVSDLCVQVYDNE